MTRGGPVSDIAVEEQVWQKIRETGGELTFGLEGSHRLTVQDFAALLGTPAAEFSDAALATIAHANFEYRFLTPEERESLLVDILTTIESGKLTVSGPQKQAIWDNGWSENLQDFTASGFEPSALIPKFVRKGVPKRLNGAFIMPASDDFESDFVKVLRDVVFRRYFHDVSALYEFGCGTGANLLAAADILPGKALHGLDWSVASTKILALLAESKKLDIHGHFFDMFQPDASLPLGARDGVLTIGALEQLGGNFKDFLQFLLEKSPQVCVHCETMNELYDRKTVPDYLASAYSKARNYLWGFLTELRQLEADGKVRILQTQRVFGSQFHEGYSFVAWSPVRR